MEKCRNPDCTKPAVARGLCSSCYGLMRRTGTFERKYTVNDGKCTIVGCGGKFFSKGFCQKHYDAQRHPLIASWQALRVRAPGAYPPAWDRFDAFLKDVGERPGPKHQLRRIDGNKAWGAGNWVWLEPARPAADHYEPFERKSYERAWRFKKKFGITTADYERMFAEQSGLCAICERPPTRISRKQGKVMDLAVDHDHDTGEVRGLLCTDCNTVLGLMNDSPDRLWAAISYLNRHKRPKLVCDAAD